MLKLSISPPRKNRAEPARRSVMLHMRISRSRLSSRCHRAAYLTATDASRLVATHRMRLDRGPSPAQHQAGVAPEAQSLRDRGAAQQVGRGDQGFSRDLAVLAKPGSDVHRVAEIRDLPLRDAALTDDAWTGMDAGAEPRHDTEGISRSTMTESVSADVSFIGPSFSASLRGGRTGSARSRPFGSSSRSAEPRRRAARYNASGDLRGGRAPARPASGPRDALRRPAVRPRPQSSVPRPSALLRGTVARKWPAESDRRAT